MSKDHDEIAAVRRRITRLERLGLLTLFAVVGGLLAAGLLLHIEGAVISNGHLVADTNTKTVQHPSGGIVARILVRDSDDVKAGDVLVRLDETVARAELAIVDSRLVEMGVRKARLIAEATSQPSVVVPPDIEARRGGPLVEAAIKAELSLFSARRAANDGVRRQLEARIAQSEEEIRGLEAQRVAVDESTALLKREHESLSGLISKKLVTQTRWLALQRSIAENTGNIGRIEASIASAKSVIVETRLRIAQIDQDFQSEAAKEMRDVQAQITEYQERRTAAADTLSRIDIRAPVSGRIHDIRVHSEGAVIRAGDPVMFVVPSEDALVIESRVSPTEIDELAVGAQARVRILSGNQRLMPMLDGEILRISPELEEDQRTGQAFYTVRTRLERPVEERSEIPTLLAGMPADVYFTTGARTPLQYLLQPLTEQIERSWRER